MSDALRRRVTVEADAGRAFDVFTKGFDSWWPRTRHIGKSPIKRAIIEGRVNGRRYTEQEDGTDCDWATVLVWDPPTGLVLAWQITHEWGYEPDLARASEVEIRFTALRDGSTRVDLEHRYFERHGEGGPVLRKAVGSPGGWNDLLAMFAAKPNATERGVES